jgi:hypothetical protein
MRARTIQVIWHSKEPVLGLDFHPSNPTLLATCGGDKDVKVVSSEVAFVAVQATAPCSQQNYLLCNILLLPTVLTAMFL